MTLLKNLGNPKYRVRLVTAAVGAAVLLSFLGYLIVSSGGDTVAAGANSGSTSGTVGTTTREPDARSGRAVVTIRSGSWSDPAVWKAGRPPGRNDAVTIGHRVSYDVGSASVAGVRIKAGGALMFDPNRSATLQSNHNVIVDGTLAMKPASPSIKHLLRFEGIDEAKFQGGGMDPLPSDVGLWVMGAGLLDTEGADKTDWTHAAGAVAGGAAVVELESTPRGWQVGDDIVIAPSEPPSAGDVSWTGFDEAAITGISGAVIKLSKATTRPHPSVNGRWTAEVMNLTRNVAIEGTAAGRSHIFIRSSKAQSIKNTAIRHMGPRQPGKEEFTDPVKGRYGLHFHHAMDGSRGSVVSGTVVRDTGAHAFVAHMSHGITFDSTVSYNTFDDAYWWDPPTERYPEPPDNFTHDTVYQNAIAAKVHFDPEFRGYRLTGFFLGTGLRNVVRGCVAVGIGGNGDSSGFSWPEVSGVKADGAVADGSNSWLFHDNLAHNNARQGIFVWQNNGNDHVVERFTGYYNAGSGVRWGAYTNRYHFIDNVLYGNAESQFFALGLGGGGRQHQYDGFKLVGSTLDAANQSDYSLSLPARSVVEPEQEHLHPGGMIQGNTFAGYRKAAVNLTARELDDNLYINNWLLVNNTWGSPNRNKDFALSETPTSTIPAATVLRVQDTRHGRIVVRRANQPGTLNRAWNARVTTDGSNSDSLPPLLSITGPGFGDDALAGGFAVSGTVRVAASAYDDVGVSRVEFLVDGALKATDTSAPYGYAWNAHGLPHGSSHTLVAKAYDAAGHVAQARTMVTIGVTNGHHHR